jgi:Flp pilus assembly protein TadG
MKSRIICKARRAGRTGRTRWKSGVAALELILATPVFLVFLLGVVQFGVFFTRMQTVALACRNGAEIASESSLPLAGEVPDNVLAAIDQQLLASNIVRCRVRLEHNVGGSQAVLTTGTCDCGPDAVLTPSLPLDRYVRVTVCVPLSQVMPNLLATFGWSVDCPGYLAECTTVMRHEL